MTPQVRMRRRWGPFAAIFLLVGLSGSSLVAAWSAPCSGVRVLIANQTTTPILDVTVTRTWSGSGLRRFVWPHAVTPGQSINFDFLEGLGFDRYLAIQENVTVEWRRSHAAVAEQFAADLEYVPPGTIIHVVITDSTAIGFVTDNPHPMNRATANARESLLTEAWNWSRCVLPTRI